MASDFETSTAADSRTGALASEFGQMPRIGILESARRYWPLVLLSVVLFAALAGLAVYSRSATYTAEARLQVGRLNVSAPGAIAGFAEASQTLASGFSRAVTADGVVDPLAKKFRLNPATVRSRLSATPVPSSPIVSLFATGPSERQAIGLANAASAQLVAFLSSASQNNPDEGHLLRRIHEVDLKYQDALATLQGTHAQPPLRSAQQALAATSESYRIQLSALEAAYQNTVDSEAVSSLLQPLTAAHSASGNKGTDYQIALFGGLVVGLVVGLALATLRANMVARRVLLAPPWELKRTGP